VHWHVTCLATTYSAISTEAGKDLSTLLAPLSRTAVFDLERFIAVVTSETTSLPCALSWPIRHKSARFRACRCETGKARNVDDSVLANAPIAVSGDITLVPIAAEHAEDCYRACQDQEIMRWLPLPQPYTLEGAETWCGTQAEEFRKAGLGIHYAIQVAEQFEGCISLENTRWRESTVEIGYWLASWARGRGYMTTAVTALTGHALDLGFRRVELRIGANNSASTRVADSAGYTFEGVLRQAGHTHSGQIDLAMYSFIESDATRAKVAG
jgi:RimJ/RimL family protein N-acetyltransferase